LIDFAKVHGNGNDFIVLENLEGHYSFDDLARLARLLCRRKFSLGADGILVVEKPKNGAKADFAMRIFNSDGSEGEMCGNGARAIARYAFEKKLTVSDSTCFTTLAGLMRARVEPPFVELDMGDVPLADGIFGGKAVFCGFEFPFLFLRVGVPHCVLITKDYNALDTALKVDIGRRLSHDFDRFPEGSNVSFAQAISRDDAIAVTYERGVEDLTESCGTGCVAVAIALSSGLAAGVEAISLGDWHYNSKPLVGSSTHRIYNPGGVNEVRLNFSPDNVSYHAWLKGRTALVAEGRVLEDALLEVELMEAGLMEVEPS
jgi:diaminopimelate epimerase